MFLNSNTSLSMYLFYNSRIHIITLYLGHVYVYYASVLRCWHIVWILLRTDHPCLGVGCHKTRIHPFSNKICECLRFYRPSVDEFNIILANFYGPLCDPPHCFFTLEYTSQWEVRYNLDYVRQEVMLQLSGRHEYCVE
jgi:hypothetical protein